MEKQNLYIGIAIATAIVVVSYFFFINFVSTQNPSNNMLNSQDNNQQQQQNPTSATAEANNVKKPTSAIPTPAPNSVLVQDVSVGKGAVVAKGQTVTVEYVGKLQDGTTFDQSSAHGGTFSFVLGAGQVIPGWEQGLQGMKIGGERILIIPPTLAYGNQQVGPIPPNSTLVFDIKLVSVGDSNKPSTK